MTKEKKQLNEVNYNLSVLNIHGAFIRSKKIVLEL